MSDHSIEQFVTACEYSKKTVRKMLIKGVDINGRCSDGETGLNSAMGNNNTDIVRLLLAHSDIQIDTTDRIGRTAIYLACLHGSVESVRLFLAHSACTKDIVTMVNSLRKQLR